jgi:hypothetical protein
MRTLIAAAAVTAAIAFTGAASSPANAAPPTATVSLGYDARLAASKPTDVSARRYYRRYYRPYRYGYGPRYYRPYGYGYSPYYYGRPYGYPYGYYGGGPRFYGPGFSFGFGW